MALVLTFVGWVDIGEFEFAAWRHYEPLSEIHDVIAPLGKLGPEVSFR
jgi:hypothetical protein